MEAGNFFFDFDSHSQDVDCWYKAAVVRMYMSCIFFKRVSFSP